MSIPVIDPNVRHVGVAHLRKLNADTLRAMAKTLVIQDGDDALVVVNAHDNVLNYAGRD